MAIRVLSLQWLSGFEFITFDTDKLPAVGTQMTTQEIWAGKIEPVTYNVDCIAAKKSDKGYTFTLRYSEIKNSVLNQSKDLWGDSILKVNFETGTATADWQDGLNREDFCGQASSCRFIDGPLYEAIEREQVSRIKRKQSQFRADMLSRHNKCCLTLEEFQPVLEAAHIVDACLGGGYGISNGLLMRADFHALFDKGFINIDAGGNVICEPSLPESYRNEIKVDRLSHDVLQLVKVSLMARAELRDKPSQSNAT